MTDTPDANDDETPASEALHEVLARKSASIDPKCVAPGVATGIGSAALVAALLSSGRNKGGKTGK